MAVSSSAASIICTLIGSIGLLLPSLGYLIAQIVLQVKDGYHPEGGELAFTILTYVALSVFILTGVVGVASVIDCFGNEPGKLSKYLLGCAFHWMIWILISMGATIALIVIYSLALSENIKKPNSNTEESTNQKIIIGSWIGASGAILLFCLLPLCCCGLNRIIVTARSRGSSSPSQYSQLNNDDL
ncbi:hypothetical protein NAEGRDRAFT_80044 [Naegleria gruberi]|uniref:Uncharacterized protein n=1 Tax=Naegleria gruberi TaxID=5762 RepID=D2VI33_NAEGR|nr:uncharacterized protein NAEGRDRAFT_80044 [Naegleria gruberi]EFC43521.1 hypothetical protein NAEGRDRAFT_80044 [Naegleria gruberi]|eukprot:XP_002676265.1 hypothetical protein NAEGRDRAFT_80044 [Naegleria gruberi strain NEG-M]